MLHTDWTINHLNYYEGQVGQVDHITYITLYHPIIENKANQNTAKPLYIPRYFTQPSHRAPRVCHIVLAIVFSMAWSEIVCNPLSCNTMEYLTCHLVFSQYTQSPEGSCVSKKIIVTSEIFNGIALQRVA